MGIDIGTVSDEGARGVWPVARAVLRGRFVGIGRRSMIDFRRYGQIPEQAGNHER
jgi:hypothetical protein